jgi:hypothetical protein
MFREFYIAGVQHHKGVSIQSKLSEDDELILRPEPDNKYDPNAVAIIWNDDGNEDDVMMGYVPAKFAGEVNASLIVAEASGGEVKCILTEVNLSAKTWERFKVKIVEVDNEEVENG